MVIILKGQTQIVNNWTKSISEDFALRFTFDLEIFQLAYNLTSSSLPIPTGIFWFNIHSAGTKVHSFGQPRSSKRENK